MRRKRENDRGREKSLACAFLSPWTFFLFFHPPKVGINTVTIVCVSIDRRAAAAAVATATATADRWTRTDTSAPLHALWALYESVHTIYT